MRGFFAVRDVGIFSGRFFGWEGPCFGEIVHFHSRSFCWDILTDPAYFRKIVITDSVVVDDRQPSPEEIQSFMPHLKGLVFLGPVNKSHDGSPDTRLGRYLKANKISGFIPDRREFLNDVLSFSRLSAGGMDINRDGAINYSREPISYNEDDLKSISAPQEFLWELTNGDLPTEERNIVVWDFGANYNLLRSLRLLGCRVRVAPPDTQPEDIVALHPDGVVIAGGPISSMNMNGVIAKIERLIGIRPLLGVGAAAVLLARALDMTIVPLRSPHFGTAIPVEDTMTARVIATYQAHSAAVDPASVEDSDSKITHVNVCDGSVEGFSNTEYRAAGSLCLPTANETPRYLKEYLESLENSYSFA